MSQNDQRLKRRLYIVALAIFAIAYSLYCFVISPACVSAENNIAYDGTGIPEILNYLGTVISMLAVASFYTILVFGLNKFCLSEFKWIIAIFAVATLYKYSANLLVEWGRDGKIPSEWLLEVVFFVLIYVVLELLSFAIVLAIVNGIMRQHREKVKAYEKVGRAIEIYPFQRVYDKSNPLMRSAMVCAVVELVIRLATKAASDIMTIVEINNVFWMIVEYLSVLVFASLCYFIMLICFGILNKKINAAE